MPILLLACVALLSACATDPLEGWPGEHLAACDTSRTAYRIDDLTVPADSSAAEDLGWDFDGDGTIDNQGGNIMSAVKQAVDVDLAGAVQEALDADLVQIAVVVDHCADPDYALVSLARGVGLDRAFDPPRMLAEPATAYAAVATSGARPAVGGAGQFPVGQLVHPLVTEWIDAVELVVDVGSVTETGIDGRIMVVLDDAQGFETMTQALRRAIVDRLAELDAEDPEAEATRTLDLVEDLLRADVDTDGDGAPDALSIGVGFHASPVALYLAD